MPRGIGAATRHHQRVDDDASLGGNDDGIQVDLLETIAERVYGDALAMKQGKGFWRYFLRCFPLGFTSPASFRGSAKVPITIAWGDHDLILHQSQAKLAAKRMRNAEFVTLEDCGHVPMGDSPEQVVAAIRHTTARAAASAPAA